MTVRAVRPNPPPPPPPPRTPPAYGPDGVVNQDASQPSGHLDYWKNAPFSFSFSGVADCWEAYPAALTDTIFSLIVIFGTLL